MQRFIESLDAVIAQGEALKATVRSSQGSRNYYLPDSSANEGRKWIYLAQASLDRIAPAGTYWAKRLAEIISNKDMQNTAIAYHLIEKITALSDALLTELKAGHLVHWEYNVTAQNFDEFLEYADHFHSGGKRMESAVIAGAVLEDTIKKLAKKNTLSETGSLEEIIQRLTKAKVFTTVKKKRVQSFAGTRNSAMHAKWDEFDLKDVATLISGTRELIEMLES